MKRKLSNQSFFDEDEPFFGNNEKTKLIKKLIIIIPLLLILMGMLIFYTVLKSKKDKDSSYVGNTFRSMVEHTMVDTYGFDFKLNLFGTYNDCYFLPKSIKQVYGERSVCIQGTLSSSSVVFTLYPLDYEQDSNSGIDFVVTKDGVFYDITNLMYLKTDDEKTEFYAKWYENTDTAYVKVCDGITGKEIVNTFYDFVKNNGNEQKNDEGLCEITIPEGNIISDNNNVFSNIINNFHGSVSMTIESDGELSRIVANGSDISFSFNYIVNSTFSSLDSPISFVGEDDCEKILEKTLLQ